MGLPSSGPPNATLETRDVCHVQSSSHTRCQRLSEGGTNGVEAAVLASGLPRSPSRNAGAILRPAGRRIARKRPISYIEAETLDRTSEMVPESRVSAATTATTITPSTTAYSAIVWPRSPWISATISVGDSIKGIHLLGR